MAVTYTPNQSSYARGESLVVAYTPPITWTTGDSVRIMLPDLTELWTDPSWDGNPISQSVTIPIDTDLAITHLIVQDQTNMLSALGPDFLVTLGDASWLYADQQDVEDLIHENNVNIAFDTNEDGSIDTDAVQRAGEAQDAYINLKLSKGGVTSPNPLTSARDIGILKQVSAHLTVWYGFHQRGLVIGTDERLQGIAGIMEGYKAYADSLLDDLIGVLLAEDEDEDTVATGEFGFVPVVRGCTSSTDENGQ